MKLDADTETHATVRKAAEAYAQVLATAGGKELEALTRQGDRTAVCAAIYASPSYDLQVPALPVSRLSVNLTRARVSGGVGGERHRSYEALRWSIFLVPAGVPKPARVPMPFRSVRECASHPVLLCDCFEQQAVLFLFDDSVALAAALLQALSILDFDPATGVTDETCLLQLDGCLGHAFAEIKRLVLKFGSSQLPHSRMRRSSSNVRYRTERPAPGVYNLPAMPRGVDAGAGNEIRDG